MEPELNIAVSNGETTDKDPATGRFLAGNRLGRGNKGSRWVSTALQEALMEIAAGSKERQYELIIKKVISKAIAGDSHAISLIFDRAEGKALQTIDLKAEVEPAPLTEEKKRELLALLGK